MKSEELIAAFHEAWNTRDVDGVMRLTTEDCVLFDAYFADFLTSWNLAEYLREDIESANVRYTITEVIECTDELASYKYVARILDSTNNVISSYNGVERLRLRDGKIRRMTDLYVAPPELLSLYYGPGVVSSRTRRDIADANFTMNDILDCRAKMNRLMRIECPYRNPDLTLSRIASVIGHSEQLILLVLDIAFNRDFRDFVDKCRIDSAREMITQQVLAGHSDADLSVDRRIAQKVGFKSHAQFVGAFKQAFHLTPRQCRRAILKQQLTKPVIA